MAGGEIPVVPAVPAASVLIVRDSDAGLQVLMIERARSMKFAAGAMVFPGGKVDPADRQGGPTLVGFAPLDPADRDSRIAAVREVFEETGVLLSAGPLLPATVRQQLRAAAVQTPAGLGEVLVPAGHRLHAGVLKPFARWLPPAGIAHRYDTRFYVAALPAGEAATADGHEALSAAFVRPAAMLAQAKAGRASLLIPTRCNLQRLAAFADVAALFADTTPPPFVQPRAQGDTLTIAEGVGYPETRFPIGGLFRG